MMPATGRKKEYHRRVSPMVLNGGRSNDIHIIRIKLKNTASPMMVDVLPHLLLYLGGISTPLYREELNVISPKYDMKRPRILKGITDYNQLKRK